MALRVRVLGPLEVEIAGRPRPVGGATQRTVLGLLVCHAGHVVTVDRLIDGVWGDRPPGDPQHALQGQVSRVRRTFSGSPGVDVVRTTAGYRLELRDGCLDAAAFTSLAQQAEDALAAGHPAAAGSAADAGMRLWRAAPYHDVRESPAVRAERVRLEELRLRLLEVSTEAALAAGAAVATLPRLAALRDEHPYRERLWLLLARALHGAGRPHEALEVLRELTAFLREELGTDPGPEAAELYARILRHGSTPATRSGGGGPEQRPPSLRQSPSLPAPLAAVPTRGWVGRDAVTARLAGAWREADRLTVALASGEAGIGKTRLAAELARTVHAEGGNVLYGGCTRDLALPYEAFLEAFGEAGSGSSLLEGDGDAGRFVTDPATRRQQITAAITSRLAAFGQDGLLLVIDDLHWSDAATLDVLRHLARRAPPGRFLVLGTYRDTDVDGHHPLVGVVADLRRAGLAHHVALDGLSIEAVGELLRHSDVAGDHDVASRIQHACGGNPFFVNAVIDRLGDPSSATGDHRDLPVPAEIRDVVRARLADLAPSTSSILEVAAVLGPDIDVSLLAAAADAPVDEAITALDRATGGRIVHELDVGRYRFDHDIVRNVLYHGTSRTRRARLHHAIADVLEARAANPADIAHHLMAAGDDPATVRRAAQALVAAGRAALEAVAASDAIGPFARAAEIAAGLGDDALVRRARLGLGTAQRDAGDPAFRDTLLDVAADAEQARDEATLVAAALANHRGMWSALGEPDGARIAGLDRATALCTSDAQRARLLARTAIEVVFVPDRDPLALLHEASTLARGIDDPSIHAEVLFAQVTAGWQPRTGAELHRASAELVALTERVGDHAARAHALMWHSLHLRTIGATRAAREALEAAQRIADADELDTLRLYASGYWCAQAMLEGDVASATAATERTRMLGETTGQPDALEWYLSMVANIGVLEGRAGELSDVVLELPAESALASLGPYRAFTGVALLRSGQLLEGRRVWAEVADTLAGAPRDFTWLGTVCVLALGAEHADDPARCRRVHDLAAPHSGQFVNGGVVMWGALDHTLGLLASAAGDAVSAGRWFEQASHLQEEAGAAGWQIHTQLAWARHLRRTQPDSPRIAALLAAAEAAAGRLGYPALAAAVQRLQR